MMNRATPRLARFSHFRSSSMRKSVTIIMHISHGPKTELNREVHMPFTKNDLPALRQIVEALEKE